MSAPRRHHRIALAALLPAAALLLWLLLPDRTNPPAPSAPATPAAPAPPILQARRLATPESPLLAHEELLTLEGTPVTDLSALADLTKTYLERPADPARPPLGFNEDLARALTDQDALGESAIPRNHPILRDGQLIDRWGTPWQVHPLSVDILQLRSAGPDRKLYTPDDLVTP
jgi:hypothetical protein